MKTALEMLSMVLLVLKEKGLRGNELRFALKESQKIWEPLVRENQRIGRHFLQNYGHIICGEWNRCEMKAVLNDIGHSVRFNGHVAIVRFRRLGWTGTKVSISSKVAGSKKWKHASFEIGDALRSGKWTNSFGDIEKWLRENSTSRDHFILTSRLILEKLFY